MANKSTAFKYTLCLMLLTGLSTKSLLARSNKPVSKKNQTTSRSLKTDNDDTSPTGSVAERRNHFNIIVQYNQTILSWSSIESKNGKYLIYRSEDHHNFDKIGEKTIITNPNEPMLYIFHDEAPGKGLNHYKLMQQDINGNLKEVASKYVFLDSKEPNSLTNIPTPKINRI